MEPASSALPAEPPAPEPQSAGPRSRRRWRVAGWVLLGVLLLAGLLVGGTVWLLRPEALRQRLETELSTQLGAPVHVGALEYTWRQEVTLELQDMVLPAARLPGAGGASAGDTLRLGIVRLRTGLCWRAAVRAAWAAWHGGAVELASVDLRDIHWQQHSGKTWHLDRLFVLGLRKAAAGEQKVSATAVEARFGTATVRLAYPAWTPAVTQFVVQVVPVNLRELLPQWGVAVPPTTSSQAFTLMGLQAACRLTPREWACGTLQLQLDETRLEGSVTHETGTTADVGAAAPAEADGAAPAASAESGAWHFTLQADRLNLDRYLPPDDPREPPLQVPWELANVWPVDGALQVADMRVGGLRVKDATLDIRFGAKGLVVQ